MPFDLSRLVLSHFVPFDGPGLIPCPNVDQFVAIKLSWASRTEYISPGHISHDNQGLICSDTVWSPVLGASLNGHNDTIGSLIGYKDT